MGKREALIVAVSDYRDPKLRKLRAPAADAARLATVLGDPEIGGFDVEVLADPEERDLRRRLAAFFGAQDRRPDDLLLVHFSCHGVKDQGNELYLAATDTEQDFLAGTGIDATWLNQRISQCRSRRIVVLLDCCFSGSFPFGARARAGADVNVQAHLDGRGRAVITASNAIEYAYEGDRLKGKGQPSVFTDAVVEGLATGQADRDHDRRISIQELYDYVFDRVKETTPAQTPNMMSTLEGPLQIARSSYEPPIEPAPLDSHLVQLINSPLTGGRLGAVEELARLLRLDDRATKVAAHQALERMIDDDSRLVAARAREALSDTGGEPSPKAAPTISRKVSVRRRPRQLGRAPKPAAGSPRLLTAIAAPTEARRGRRSAAIFASLYLGVWWLLFALAHLTESSTDRALNDSIISHYSGVPHTLYFGLQELLSAPGRSIESTTRAQFAVLILFALPFLAGVLIDRWLAALLAINTAIALLVVDGGVLGVALPCSALSALLIALGVMAVRSWRHVRRRKALRHT